MTKLCAKCGLRKALKEFHVDRARTDGHKGTCRCCISEYNQRPSVKARGLELKRTPAGRRREHAHYVRRKYGITASAYDALLAAGCAICGRKAEHLDHNHITGAVRKALCRSCNTALGHMRDNPAILRAAADYLEEHK